MNWPYFLFGYLLLLAIGYVATRWYIRRRYTIFILTIPIKRDK